MILSLWDFECFCNQKHFKRFILNYENQSEQMPGVSYSVSFSSISFSYHPNRIILSGECGFICINDVKRVVIINDSLIGCFFNVVYADRAIEKNKTVTMIGDK